MVAMNRFHYVHLDRSSAGSSRTLVTIATSVGVVGFLVAVCINCAIICFAIARRHQTRKYYFKPGGTIEFGQFLTT